MKKVLLIEDNKEILENTSELLSLSNYKVITAENGKLGIEAALQYRPDLILCDIMMPELDGYGVLHIVQKNPFLANTPFIFLSALSENENVRKGMALGADDYISKPFDATELLEAVESRLAKAELLQSNSNVEEGLSTVLKSSDVILEEFLEGRSVDKYKKRERIFSEGNHAIRLYYVVKGKVKIYKTNDLGKELIVKIVKEGEFFGYPAIFENDVYSENADALEYSEVAAIPKAELDELVIRHPCICRKFISLLSHEVIEQEDHMLHLAYNSLRKKVADALLNLQNKYSTPGSTTIKISRENLAALAGTATESLIRTLTEFKTEKLIDITDGKIQILNALKLKQMVN